ncbi:hypothetical protein OG417_30970 [Actinoallomurus sp. NBC_01490]|jgi:hypothetical protein|uniref:hypothetical protein n=1 Tax=Actinoallomurus sp. NBC_01490 TaxID=2903557 RepID=UPI002E37E126|nr:hypothetical protein [Actinoallomurus sp. NBC_01490]
MARLIVWAWAFLVSLILILYVGAPVWFFNDASSTIAGMPPMLFWFVLLPFVVPGLIAALYFYDQRAMRKLARRREKGPNR